MKRIFTTLFLSLLFVGFTSAQKDLQILLVHDDEDATTTTEAVQSAITAAGYIYCSYYDAVTDGAPSAAQLEPYELVIWNTGKNYPASRFWDKSNADAVTANADMLSFLDNGGMLWISGLNVLADASGSAPQTFADGDFIYNYLGIESYAIQANLASMLVKADNGICTADNISWQWESISYVDHAVPTSTAKAIYTSSTHVDTAVMVYNEIADAKILSDFIRWDAFSDDDANVRNGIVTEILDHFNEYSTIIVSDVTSVEITGGTEITENSGTLQLDVTILPDDATLKTVSWSIEDGSVFSTISQTGLLTASGLDSGNGTITVKVSTKDGSGVSGTTTITVSNQTLGEGYKVLLVNDDARDYTKHLNIDTALTAANYIYKIFDAAVEGTAPGNDYLSNFDFVIWYTSRDGMNLHFWDVSDSANITCNSELKQYADNGGVVWLQGRDVFYDIWSGFSDVNSIGDSIIQGFEAGDFVYDYLGVKSYVAQSHVDETSGTFDGLEQIDITETNEITTLNPITWIYNELHYADALEATENAIPLYYMGPETYDFALYYAMIYNKNGDAQFITNGFDPSEIDTQENINTHISEVIDYFEAKSNETGIFTKEANTFDVNIYPNPANNQISLSYTFDKVENVRIQITDLSGKKMYDKSMFSTIGIQTKTLDVSNISNGIYNINISSNSTNYNQRLVIIK